MPRSKKPAKHIPLFDAIKKDYGLKNDAELARKLDITPASISKIRHDTHGVSAEVKLAVIRKLGWPIKKIDALCAQGDEDGSRNYGRRATDRAIPEAGQPGAKAPDGDGSDDAAPERVK